MNIFPSKKAAMLSSVFLHLLFTSCKKDIAGEYAGVYIGTATTYSFGPRLPEIFPDTRINMTKLSRTTIKLELIISSPDYAGTRQETVKKDGTFGDGIYTIRGTNINHGEEGRFTGDSLYLAFATSDSSSSIQFAFGGRRN